MATKLARDIMSKDLITVTPATPLHEFARICIEDEISGCPVVTVDGRLVGIVSKTDLLGRVLEGSHDYSGNPDYRALLGLGEEDVGEVGFIAEADEETEREQLGEVDDIMQGDPITVKPTAPLHEIAEVLSESKIHRVLVTEGDKLEGIITSLDLLKHFPKGA